MEQQLSLSIPEPCQQRWDKMKPTPKGAFCTACKKEVHDFSGMTNGELFHFFRQLKGQQVCGRLRREQQGVHTIYIDERVFRLRLPSWKKMLVVILVCFGPMLLTPLEAQLVELTPTTEPTNFQQQKQKKIFKQKKRNRKKKNRDWIVILEKIYPTFNFGLINHHIDPVPSPYLFPYPGTGADTIDFAESHYPNEQAPEPKKQNIVPRTFLLFKNEEEISLQSLRKKIIFSFL